MSPITEPSHKRNSCDETACCPGTPSSICSSSHDSYDDTRVTDNSKAASSTSRRPQGIHSRKQDDTPTVTRAIYNCLAWLSSSRTMPKIPLEKGYSQMDWLRLSQSSKNMNGLMGGPLRDNISMEEVRTHNTREDAWMVFNGMVYNITPYFKFHPGGADILMKAAGRDGTSLFMKYHAWVNIGALMGKCLVGRLAVNTMQAQAAAEVQQQRQHRQEQEAQLGHLQLVAEVAEREEGDGVQQPAEHHVTGQVQLQSALRETHHHSSEDGAAHQCGSRTTEVVEPSPKASQEEALEGAEQTHRVMDNE